MWLSITLGRLIQEKVRHNIIINMVILKREMVESKKILSAIGKPLKYDTVLGETIKQGLDLWHWKIKIFNERCFFRKLFQIGIGKY